jgi:hypothetical protein
MSGDRQIRSRKLGFQPDSARGHLARESTGKMPVVRDSQGGYLPKEETKK